MQPCSAVVILGATTVLRGVAVRYPDLGGGRSKRSPALGGDRGVDRVETPDPGQFDRAAVELVHPGGGDQHHDSTHGGVLDGLPLAVLVEPGRMPPDRARRALAD